MLNMYRMGNMCLHHRGKVSSALRFMRHDHLWNQQCSDQCIKRIGHSNRADHSRRAHHQSCPRIKNEKPIHIRLDLMMQQMADRIDILSQNLTEWIGRIHNQDPTMNNADRANLRSMSATTECLAGETNTAMNASQCDKKLMKGHMRRTKRLKKRTFQAIMQIKHPQDMKMTECSMNQWAIRVQCVRQVHHRPIENQQMVMSNRDLQVCVPVHLPVECRNLVANPLIKGEEMHDLLHLVSHFLAVMTSEGRPMMKT